MELKIIPTCYQVLTKNQLEMFLLKDEKQEITDDILKMKMFLCITEFIKLIKKLSMFMLIITQAKGKSYEIPPEI